MQAPALQIIVISSATIGGSEAVAKRQLLLRMVPVQFWIVILSVIKAQKTSVFMGIGH